MKTLHLRTFSAVAQEGGIRAAARKLHVSQSAVTRVVKELEQDLDVQLVRRTARGTELTPFGSAFATRANLILAESERAREELRQMKSAEKSRVRIATTSLPSLLILPSAIAEFKRLHPTVEVECLDAMVSTTLPALREGRIDFALTQDRTPPSATDLVSEALHSSPLVIGARKGHPQARQRRLHGLVDEEWVAGSVEMAEVPFRALGLPPPRRVTIAQSFLLTIQLLQRSDLLSIFPRPVLEHSSVKGPVQILPIADSLPQITVSIVSRRGVPLTPAAAMLAEAIRSSQRIHLP